MIKRLHARVYHGGRRRWFTMAAAVRSEAQMLIDDAQKRGDIGEIHRRDRLLVLDAVAARVKAGGAPGGQEIAAIVAAVAVERLKTEPELT